LHTYLYQRRPKLTVRIAAQMAFDEPQAAKGVLVSPFELNSLEFHKGNFPSSLCVLPVDAPFPLHHLRRQAAYNGAQNAHTPGQFGSFDPHVHAAGVQPG
jgi:hypothetical protein